MRGKIYSSIIWVYGERIIIQLINLLISILLARVLTPYEYGMVAIVMIFINLTDALVVGGFGNSLIQKSKSTEQDYNSVAWLSILIAILLYILLYFFAPNIAIFYKNNQLILITRILGIKIIFSAFNSIQQAYIQKNMLFKKYFISTFIGTVLSGIISIIMLNFNYGIWILVTQQLISTIVSTVILYYSSEWKLRLEFSINSIKEIWDFSYKMLVSTIVYTLKDNIRQLVISKNFTPSNLAYYNQGIKYPTILVSNTTEALAKIVFPLLSEKQHNIKEMKKIMRFSIRISSFILTPCIIGIFVLSDTFIKVVLTEKWLESTSFMRIICLAYITRAMTTILQRGILAKGKSNINLYHEIITSILTVILILISTLKYHNIYLIAWSYVIITILGLSFYLYYIQKIFSYTVLEVLEDYLPTLIFSIIMGGIIHIIGNFFYNEVLKFSIQIIIGMVSYFFMLFIFKEKTFIYIKDVILKRKKLGGRM